MGHDAASVGVGFEWLRSSDSRSNRENLWARGLCHRAAATQASTDSAINLRFTIESVGLSPQSSLGAERGSQ